MRGTDNQIYYKADIQDDKILLPVTWNVHTIQANATVSIKNGKGWLLQEMEPWGNGRVRGRCCVRF